MKKIKILIVWVNETKLNRDYMYNLVNDGSVINAVILAHKINEANYINKHKDEFDICIDTTINKNIKCTKVIFRYWKKEVIAIFPELPGTNNIFTCESYIHNGQHGACTPKDIVSNSRLATKEEYNSLKTELEGIGYNLIVMERIQKTNRQTRNNIIESIG